MNKHDYFLENCMTWLTDLSVYRSRLTKMYKRLPVLKEQFLAEKKHDQFVSLAQKFQNAFKKLHIIEHKLSHTINKRINELYKAGRHGNFGLENEDELYDNMRFAHSLLLDLQHSMSIGTAPEQPVGRKSILITMPGARKVKMSKSV